MALSSPSQIHTLYFLETLIKINIVLELNYTFEDELIYYLTPSAEYAPTASLIQTIQLCCLLCSTHYSKGQSSLAAFSIIWLDHFILNYLLGIHSTLNNGHVNGERGAQRMGKRRQIESTQVICLWQGLSVRKSEPPIANLSFFRLPAAILLRTLNPTSVSIHQAEAEWPESKLCFQITPG